MSGAPLLVAKRSTGPFIDTIDAALELGAYETLWSEHNASFKTIAAKFAEREGARPSDFVPEEEARDEGRLLAEASVHSTCLPGDGSSRQGSPCPAAA